MLFGDKGVEVFFEIKPLGEMTPTDTIQSLINHKTPKLTYRFAVEMITYRDGIDIGIRDTIVSQSEETFSTRTGALTAAAEFIEDYKKRLKESQ